MLERQDWHAGTPEARTLVPARPELRSRGHVTLPTRSEWGGGSRDQEGTWHRLMRGKSVRRGLCQG